jgi:hypothetical protein
MLSHRFLKLPAIAQLPSLSFHRSTAANVAAMSLAARRRAAKTTKPKGPASFGADLLLPQAPTPAGCAALARTVLEHLLYLRGATPVLLHELEASTLGSSLGRSLTVAEGAAGQRRAAGADRRTQKVPAATWALPGAFSVPTLCMPAFSVPPPPPRPRPRSS